MSLCLKSLLLLVRILSPDSRGFGPILSSAVVMLVQIHVVEDASIVVGKVLLSCLKLSLVTLSAAESLKPLKYSKVSFKEPN